MQLDKLEAIHKVLESLGRDMLTGNFDVKMTLASIIVILKEMVDYEIEKQKVPTTPYT
jgi:hypothetical protein